MNKKKLIPRPKLQILKVTTPLGYTFQNNKDIVSFKRGGILDSGFRTYGDGGRTFRNEGYEINTTTEGKEPGKTITRKLKYRGTSVDYPNKPTVYTRYGLPQTKETIDDYKNKMLEIRRRFKNVQTQDEVVDLIKNGTIKPYEGQLLLQAIAAERADELGKEGQFNFKPDNKFTDHYALDEKTGLNFKLDKEKGIITFKRDKLNDYLRTRALEKDKNFAGWENLDPELEYELGVASSTEKKTGTPKNYVVEIIPVIPGLGRGYVGTGFHVRINIIDKETGNIVDSYVRIVDTPQQEQIKSRTNIDVWKYGKYDFNNLPKEFLKIVESYSRVHPNPEQIAKTKPEAEEQTNQNWIKTIMEGLRDIYRGGIKKGKIQESELLEAVKRLAEDPRFKSLPYHHKLMKVREEIIKMYPPKNYEW